MLDKPTTEHRTYCRGDRCESRPGTDRVTAPLLREIGADQSQAAWDEQRATYSLKTPRENQIANVVCKSAPDRGKGEKGDTGGEDVAPAVQVPQRPAREKQCCHKKRVSFHDPLDLRNRCT